MRKGLNPVIAGLIAMGMMIDPYARFEKQEDELEQYFRINKTTLEKEYQKIQKKQSGLSRRLRQICIYRYEQKGKSND